MNETEVEKDKEKEKEQEKERIEKEKQNIIMKNLMKENEILSKVIKGKMNGNEALNELLKILNEQRDFIENISEEHLMLEKSVTRLNTSIDILKTKLKVPPEDLNINKIINANKVQFKPNEAISFSKLNNISNTQANQQIMNNTFNNRKKIKTPNPIKLNTNTNGSNISKNNIDYDRLLQMSVTDFKKKKLKPINKNLNSNKK